MSTLLSLIVAPPSDAMPVAIASDMTPTGSLNLVSFTTDAPAFSSAGDGFQKYQRGVSPSIPFAVLDDSLVGFPSDSLGIVDENNTDEFFGLTDTINGDNPGSVAYNATWTFDITGGTNMGLSIDMGAMGDFEPNDTFTWTYAIDGGTPSTIFTLVVDENDTRDYTLAGGTLFNLSDPLNVDAIGLSNVFTTVSAPLVGTGSTLTLNLEASTDGGSEAAAFQNIVITSDDVGGGPDPMPGDLVITEVMQNPSAVSDASGEWFEIHNTSAQTISLDGWLISDADGDSYVITGAVDVAPGDYLVLGNNADMTTNGGVVVDHEYTGFNLANGADEVVLTAPTEVEFDRIEYDGGPTWPDPTGASMSLDPASTDVDDNDDGGNWCNASTPYGDGDLGTPGAANPTCPIVPVTTLIHDIQGSGPTVAITTPVEVEAVVTSLFTRDDVLDGFFIQEEDVDNDLDPLTSEGIFVFCRGNCPDPTTVQPGTQVTVTGTPTDFFGMSQIDMTAGSVTPQGPVSLPTPLPVALPASGSTTAEATFEPVEGMLVTFTDTLAVSEYFQLARYGQIVLTDESRPYQFTHTNVPSVAGYTAFLDDLATRRIILDDDNNDQNDATSDGADEVYPYPEPGLSLTDRFRGGDTITDLTGVMHWSFAGQSGTDAWRVRPVPQVYDYTFTPVNTAPSSPSPVGGTLTVGSFNVLNYFTTLDEPGATCGPSADDCRGANSAAELVRQRDKIVAAIAELDADVLGLVELENDGDDSSIADLVAALNASVGAGTYDYIPTGSIGLDAIKVGLIYRTASVIPVGAPAILDDSVDPTFIEAKNRPVLIHTFEELSNGERFTIAVNHLKSKGSPCDDVGDPGLGDGQANCAGTRTAAATALANYLATDPTGSGDPDFLIVGDLNSYAMEDPITALTGAGYTDLVAQFEGPGAYSFVFDGQLGYLDHALANSALLPQVTGVASWHINADEVNIFDYNDDVQDAAEASFERESTLAPYAPDELRSSDHDPVMVGLALSSTPPVPMCDGQEATIVGTDGGEFLLGTPGDDVIVALGGADLVFSLGGSDIVCLGDGDDWLLSGPGDDVAFGEAGMDRIFLGADNDIASGGDDNDLIFGEQGNDVLFGDAGLDILFGQQGDDELDGGVGEGLGDGGAGFDVCVSLLAAANCEGPLVLGNEPG